MQVWPEIRRKVLVEKVPIRQICREYQISHHTLEKMLQGVDPPDYQQRPGKRPRLGPFLGVIDQIFEDDQTAPKTQRHTAKRIFEPLRAEHGYADARRKVALAVMSRPYSDTLSFFVSTFPREFVETFHKSHDDAFEFFSGVPTKITPDNTTVAAKKSSRGPTANSPPSSYNSRATSCSLTGSVGWRGATRRATWSPSSVITDPP